MEVNVKEHDRDDHQNFNDELENNESDIDEDQFFDEDGFSSPTNSDGNPWYAYRGRINGINNQEINNLHQEPQQIEHPEIPIQNEEEEEEETDFLEMDFEPENSEIENENEMLNGRNDAINGNHMNDNQLQNNKALENFNNQASTSSSQHINNHNHNHNHNNKNINNNNNNSNNIINNHSNIMDEPCSSNHQENFKNTGAKPKVLKQQSLSQKPIKQRQVIDGDNVFKITGNLPSYRYNNQEYCDSDVGSTFFNREKTSSLLKSYRSPVKSCHNNHKQHDLEKQNESFLFEIEPIRPRNSVTIYTSNCDEKILLDALTSIKLNPDREMISNYFKDLKIAPDLSLVDYIIHRSKLNCNYKKLIDLIKRACKNDVEEEEEENYSSKRIEINFYPLDFFSTTPEMIDIEVHEIVKRWTPQTDLTPLACIKNKHFFQTNVLGKIVNLIRKVSGNHKPGSVLIFQENETIKIPQFYVSGYITITSLRNHQT